MAGIVQAASWSPPDSITPPLSNWQLAKSVREVNGRRAADDGPRREQRQREVCHEAGRECRGSQTTHHRHDAQEQGQRLFHRLPQRAREAAAKELGVKLIWDGPTEPDPAKQNEIVETWITRGVDVIAVAVENREGISTVLRKARRTGHQGRHLGRRCRSPTLAIFSSTRPRPRASATR